MIYFHAIDIQIVVGNGVLVALGLQLLGKNSTREMVCSSFQFVENYEKFNISSILIKLVIIHFPDLHVVANLFSCLVIFLNQWSL